MPSEEIAFTAWPKINSQSQIFMYGRSIFCLPHQPKFFDLCLHWVLVVRGLIIRKDCTPMLTKILHGLSFLKTLLLKGWSRNWFHEKSSADVRTLFTGFSLEYYWEWWCGGAGVLFCAVFSAPALGKAGLAQSSSSQYL